MFLTTISIWLRMAALSPSSNSFFLCKFPELASTYLMSRRSWRWWCSSSRGICILGAHFPRTTCLSREGSSWRSELYTISCFLRCCQCGWRSTSSTGSSCSSEKRNHGCRSTKSRSKYGIEELCDQAVERIYLGLGHLELVVESEKLHHEHKVHPVFRTLAHNSFENDHPLTHYCLLRKNLLDQLHLSAGLVGFGRVDFVAIHHSFDFVLDLSIPLNILNRTV